MPRRNSRQQPRDDLPTFESPTRDSSRDAYSFKARFGALIAATGVAGVPRALCHYLGELGLSYADLGFITHVLSYRWTTAYPFPAQRRLADQAGIGRTGVQRRVYALQALGYLAVTERFDQRDGRRTSNGYDFSPLLERLNELILRDWDTVWKHRDPLVSDGEDELDAAQPDVDNRRDRPQMATGGGTPKWAGGGTQKAAGAGAELAARPADKKRPEQDLPVKRTGGNPRDKSKRDEPERDQDLRTTTNSIPRPFSEAQGPAEDTAFLDSIVDEYSDRFGDSRHVASNRSRARRLWARTDLSAREFAAALTEAGSRSAAHADRVESAMPYFFGVLQGVLRAKGFDVDGRAAPASQGERILDDVRRALAQRVRPELADRWLRGARFLEVQPDEHRCVLGVPDGDGAHKLGAEYRRLLDRAVSGVVGQPVQVEVVPLEVSDPD